MTGMFHMLNLDLALEYDLDCNSDGKKRRLHLPTALRPHNDPWAVAIQRILEVVKQHRPKHSCFALRTKNLIKLTQLSDTGTGTLAQNRFGVHNIAPESEEYSKGTYKKPGWF